MAEQAQSHEGPYSKPILHIKNPMTDMMIGDTPVMQKLRAEINRFANTALPVLIQGPTGSGKELVAAAIHTGSGRRGSFVPFNVCAIGDTMIEDSLFGHVRGAFTGAIREALGYLAEANDGTIFLDEIGGLPMPIQAKLLRVLETQTFRAIGASRDRTSNFRVVAATNEAVVDLVASERFRADLAYRLQGVTIQVPALRDRLPDLTPLAHHFLSRVTGVEWRVTSGALDAMAAYHWPGNVRELRFVLERAALYSSGSLLSRAAVVEAIGPRDRVVADFSHFSQRRLVQLLASNEWDTLKVAKVLGVHRATVYRQMKRLRIAIDLNRRSLDSAEREEIRDSAAADVECDGTL